MAPAASAPATTTCNARTKSGTTCRKPAGAGTNHPGIGRCKHHLGNTQLNQVRAAKELAIQRGGELDLDPLEALLLTVRRAAMWERICAQHAADLTDDELVVTHKRERTVLHGDRDSYVETSNQTDLNIWLREHHKALDQLARLAKCAKDAGVQDRLVRLEECMVILQADAFKLLLDLLGVADHPDAPKAMRAALELIQGGSVAA